MLLFTLKTVIVLAWIIGLSLCYYSRKKLKLFYRSRKIIFYSFPVNISILFGYYSRKKILFICMNNRIVLGYYSRQKIILYFSVNNWIIFVYYSRENLISFYCVNNWFFIGDYSRKIYNFFAWIIAKIIPIIPAIK